MRRQTLGRSTEGTIQPDRVPHQPVEEPRQEQQRKAAALVRLNEQNVPCSSKATNVTAVCINQCALDRDCQCDPVYAHSEQAISPTKQAAAAKSRGSRYERCVQTEMPTDAKMAARSESAMMCLQQASNCGQGNIGAAILTATHGVAVSLKSAPGVGRRDAQADAQGFCRG